MYYYGISPNNNFIYRNFFPYNFPSFMHTSMSCIHQERICIIFDKNYMLVCYKTR